MKGLFDGDKDVGGNKNNAGGDEKRLGEKEGGKVWFHG